jgi:hypothetical protein
MEKFLVETIKKLSGRYKEAIQKKFKETTDLNLAPLKALKERISEVHKSGESLIKVIINQLLPSSNFTDEKRTAIQGIYFLNQKPGNINKVQGFYEDIAKIKRISREFSFDQLDVNWNLTDSQLKQSLIEVRNGFHDRFEKVFSSEEFLNGVIVKPEKRVDPEECPKSIQVTLKKIYFDRKWLGL